MEPDEYLSRTRPPRPGPFLRETVLQRAELEWHAADNRLILPIIFHPFTAAALLAFSLFLGFLTTAIDDRITAALLNDSQPGTPAATVERQNAHAGQSQALEEDQKDLLETPVRIGFGGFRGGWTRDDSLPPG